MNAYIAGTGRFLPPDILTNEKLSQMVDTSDEWIVTRTGISTRHIAREMSACDMGEQAARQALESASCDPSEIDMVVVSTSTHDRYLPSVACDLQYRLHMNNAFCFDVNAACSGFVYSLDVASRYLMTGGAKTALVVSTEKLSKIVDYTDRTTCILFGDGAGAVVLRASEQPGGWRGSFLAARGDGGVALRTDIGQHVHMDGHEVYKFAVRAMPEAMEKVLEKTGCTARDLAYVIPHQANIRIIESAMHRLNIPQEKMIISLDRYGNTSSSSIPIALDELVRGDCLSKGDLVMMVGFGAGLTYGAALFEWSV